MIQSRSWNVSLQCILIMVNAATHLEQFCSNIRQTSTDQFRSLHVSTLSYEESAPSAFDKVENQSHRPMTTSDGNDQIIVDPLMVASSHHILHGETMGHSWPGTPSVSGRMSSAGCASGCVDCLLLGALTQQGPAGHCLHHMRHCQPYLNIPTVRPFVTLLKISGKFA